MCVVVGGGRYNPGHMGMHPGMHPRGLYLSYDPMYVLQHCGAIYGLYS